MVNANHVSASIRLILQNGNGVRTWSGVRHNIVQADVSRLLAGVNALRNVPATNAILSVRAELVRQTP